MIFVAQTMAGGEIRWRDRKRYLWLFSVLMPLLPFAVSMIILSTGNPWWAALILLIDFGLIPVLDLVFGEDPNNPPEEVVETLAADQWYRGLLFASILAYYASFFAVAFVIGTVAMPIGAFLLLAVGAGVGAGSALTVGHELGHKPHRLDRFGAKLVNALSGYGHFCIEHNRGHHTMVATPEDPASARLGESIYAFALREIPGAAARGWRHERERLARKGLPFWHWRNDILQGYAITLAIAVVLIATFGWIMLPFLAIHHVFGWLQLTFANYVEHYGLLRDRKANGRYAPCEPRHSWNTNHIVSNLLLFHLQRHSDHHANPLRPYQTLRNFEELPRLPSGYPGSFALAAIPPLWFRVMDRKVLDWAGGDVARTNHVAGYRAAPSSTT